MLRFGSQILSASLSGKCLISNVWSYRVLVESFDSRASWKEVRCWTACPGGDIGSLYPFSSSLLLSFDEVNRLPCVLPAWCTVQSMGPSNPELKPQRLKPGAEASLFFLMRYLRRLFCYVRKANDSARMLRSWNTKFCTMARVGLLKDSQVTSPQDNSEAQERQCGAAGRAFSAKNLLCGYEDLSSVPSAMWNC